MIPAAVAVPGAATLVEGLASFAGGRTQSRAAQRAADAQIAAQQRAMDFQEKMYGETKENFQPYLNAGQRGIAGYEEAVGNFQNPTLAYQQKDFNLANWKDPGYDFRLSEAQKAIDASTAAKGMTLGSGALKSMQTRGQDMASQEYQNAYNRHLQDSALRYGQASDQWKRDYDSQNQNVANWGNLAKFGSDAASSIGSFGAGYAGNIGNLMAAQGEAAGNAKLAEGGANAAGWSNLGKGLSSGITNWKMYNDAETDKKNLELYGF